MLFAVIAFISVRRGRIIMRQRCFGSMRVHRPVAMDVRLRGFHRRRMNMGRPGFGHAVRTRVRAERQRCVRQEDAKRIERGQRERRS